MSKFGRRVKTAPDGFEILEPTLTALDNELRERVNDPHEGLRKNESLWPVHQVNWQRTRYVYDMYYTYSKIPKEVYDYCIINKVVDAPLIAKWRKPGYERLCSTYVINPRNYKFGTVSICRVPKKMLGDDGVGVEDPTTGCRGCASGNGGNIFGNKYGQYLAAIQVARDQRKEERRRLIEAQAKDAEDDDDDNSVKSSDVEEDEDEDKDEGKGKNKGKGKDDDDDDEQGPVGAADGSSGRKDVVWAVSENDNEIQMEESMIGKLTAEASREATQALSKQGKNQLAGGSAGPPGKRSRPTR